jgi:hypothetical protein
MYPHSLDQICLTIVLFLACILLFADRANAKQGPPPGGSLAVVVDERLSALRSTPELSGKLIRRLGRGRLVAIRAIKRSSDGVEFARVNLSTRTRGWIQRAAIVSPSRRGDDERLLNLIFKSDDFDLIARARIFLDTFPRSDLRPRVLLLLGEAGELAATRLTRDATRRLRSVIFSEAAPEFSYYLNFSGLDRYNRQGVIFKFDSSAKRFHYDGAAWRELIRRYPSAREATVARERLAHITH